MVEGTNTNGEKSIYDFNGLGMLVQNTWIVANNAYGYHKMEGMTDAEYDVKKPEIVVKDFVLDYNSPVQAPLTETEEGSNGLTYRYTYGLERVSVQIGNITTSSGNLVTPQNTVKLYYHTDRLGSYRYLTDDVKGKVTSWTDYDEWGQITHNAVLKMGKRQLDLVKNYTGHEYDSVLSLYYAKARMYDAQDKRFTQVDPIKGTIAIPLTLIQYSYVQNNPISFTDPLGLFSFSDRFTTAFYPHPDKDDVKMLQSRLKELGYYSGEIDGYYHAATVTAVNAYKDATIPYGNMGENRGVTGPSTWLQLGLPIELDFQEIPPILESDYFVKLDCDGKNNDHDFIPYSEWTSSAFNGGFSGNVNIGGSYSIASNTPNNSNNNSSKGVGASFGFSGDLVELAHSKHDAQDTSRVISVQIAKVNAQAQASSSGIGTDVGVAGASVTAIRSYYIPEIDMTLSVGGEIDIASIGLAYGTTGGYSKLGASAGVGAYLIIDCSLGNSVSSSPNP